MDRPLYLFFWPKMTEQKFQMNQTRMAGIPLPWPIRRGWHEFAISGAVLQ